MPKQGKGAPTLDDCQRAGRHDVNMWELRDARFRTDQNTLFLKAESIDTDVVIGSDPAFITEKLVRRITAIPIDPHVKARFSDVSGRERAQIITNYLVQLRRDWQKMYSYGSGGNLDYGVAQYMGRRGWVCARLMLCSMDDCGVPTHLTLQDPATVYPYWVGDELVRVTQVHKARVDELILDSGLKEVEQSLATMSDDQLVSVWSQYWKRPNGKTYHAMWVAGSAATSQGVYEEGQGSSANVQGTWLKKPVELGYMPWVFSMPIGVPWRATDFDQTDYIAHIGESFITTSAGMFKEINKVLSQVSTLLSGMANPAAAMFVDEDEHRIKKDDFTLKPGSLMIFPKGHIELFRPGPEMGHVIAYYQLLQERVLKATFSAASFGTGVGIESGYMADVLQTENNDIFNPYVKALQDLWTHIFDKAVYLTAMYWDKTVEVYVEGSINRPAGWVQLHPLMLLEERPVIEVSTSTMTVGQKMQMAGLVDMLTRSRVLSPTTARGPDWLDVKDPPLEHQQVLADLVWLDPNMVKAMMPLALQLLGDEATQQLYGMLHSGEIMQALQKGMMSLTGGGQGVQEPQPAGVPGQVAPPPVTTGMPNVSGQEQELVRMAQSMRGMMGASGGMGGGGMPPGQRMGEPNY